MRFEPLRRLPWLALASTFSLAVSCLSHAGEIGDLLLSRADQMRPDTRSSGAADPARSSPHYRRIGLERGRKCSQDPCPSYTLFLYSDDSVLYTGNGFQSGAALPNGQVVARLEPKIAANLRAYIETLKLGSRDNLGDSLYGIPGSSTWAIILLETDEEFRLIVDYGHAAPPEIWALVGLLEHAAGSALHGSVFDD